MLTGVDPTKYIYLEHVAGMLTGKKPHCEEKNQH